MSVEELNNFCKSTLIENLGIEFTYIDNETVEATMPVNEKTIQPMKILHGGAIMALAETIGSAGSINLVDLKKFNVVGMEINGNHVSSASQGFVKGIAKIIHKGKKSHVWEVKVTDEYQKLLSICRITNMVVEIKREDD